jgi:hypothetical protein
MTVIAGPPAAGVAHSAHAFDNVEQQTDHEGHS